MYNSINHTKLYHFTRWHSGHGVAHKPILKILPLLCIIGIQSCTGKYEFHKPDDALNEYQLFLNNLESRADCSTKQMSDLICEWQELSDTVYSYLVCHDDLKSHGRDALFFGISDSIRFHLTDLLSSRTWHFDDVLAIKLASNQYRNDLKLDSLKNECISFFNQMDKSDIKKVDGETALTDYGNYITSVYASGIHSKDEFYRYLKLEDILFRRYLHNLGELMDKSMTQVTFETDSICRQVLSSSEERELDGAEVMAMLAMRTNRRLIQNAMSSLKLMEIKDDLDSEKNTALIWMAIQPFFSIDQISMAFLSDDQKSELQDIASRLPAVAEQCASKNDNINRLITELPGRILQLYISTL